MCWLLLPLAAAAAVILQSFKRKRELVVSIMAALV